MAESDFTHQYNTSLPPPQENAFRGWMDRQSDGMARNISRDLFNYDLRGWYAKNQGADLGGGHLTDEFKKPNHPTFSDESKYHGVDGHQGGSWSQDSDGHYTFTTGKTNLQQHSAGELSDYFQQVEPGNKLVLGQDQGQF